MTSITPPNYEENAMDYFTNENIIKVVGMDNIIISVSLLLLVMGARLIYVERTIAKFKKLALSECRRKFYEEVANANIKICKTTIEKLISSNRSPELLCVVAVAINDIRKLWKHSISFEASLLGILKTLSRALPPRDILNDLHGVITDDFFYFNERMGSRKKETNTLNGFLKYLTSDYLDDLKYSDNIKECSDDVQKKLSEYFSRHPLPPEQPITLPKPKKTE